MRDYVYGGSFLGRYTHSCSYNFSNSLIEVYFFNLKTMWSLEIQKISNFVTIFVILLDYCRYRLHTGLVLKQKPLIVSD